MTPRILLIDNYDSFTYNLVQAFLILGADVDVQRNDAIEVETALAGDYTHLVISPGPGTPRDAGVSMRMIAAFAGRLPIFGVCLGHQSMVEAFGGKVVRAPTPVHGKLSTIRHGGDGVFRGINAPFQATRYHSLVVERTSLPADLAVTADTEDGLIMGLAHRQLPVHGVQFHPESIASEHGHLMLKNFLDLAAQWNASHRGGAAMPSAPKARASRARAHAH